MAWAMRCGLEPSSRCTTGASRQGSGRGWPGLALLAIHLFLFQGPAAPAQLWDRSENWIHN